MYAKDPQAGGLPGPHRICGQHDFALSNRVSYEYDLRGPSATVKSACSSSMMALHDAVRSIQAGDCDSAIVAGTSLIFTPTATGAMWPALSSDGICRSFDASANGYTRAEAINAMYIKPLGRAIQDKDPIRCVIRGVAANFDGKTSNITLPSSQLQEVMMRKAYADAGLDPKDTPYVEVSESVPLKVAILTFSLRLTELVPPLEIHRKQTPLHESLAAMKRSILAALSPTSGTVKVHQASPLFLKLSWLWRKRRYPRISISNNLIQKFILKSRTWPSRLGWYRGRKEE